MSYIVFSDDSDAPKLNVRVATDALILAEDLHSRGQSRVQIGLPDGTIVELRQFAALLRIDRRAA